MAQSGTILDITDEAGGARRVNLGGDRFVVGRLPELEVSLPADGVSRKHAEFVRDPAGRWWLRDLGSRNGTRVNGRSITETSLAGGETVQIGPYVLRLLTPDNRLRPLTTIIGKAQVTHDEPGPLQSLAEMPSPQVRATHLSRLAQFGHDLSREMDSAARLRLLCELMTSGDFPGMWSVAVRIEADSEAPSPSLLLTPVHRSRTAPSKVPYLSTRLLSAVRERRAPVMASNVGAGVSDVLVSVAPSVQAHTAIACPIGGDQSLDILYTALSPTGTTGEWLALAGLAAEQYRLSESLWTERKLAQDHALIQMELEQAREVQGRLVRRDVKLAGVDYAIEFHPCRWVGGDYVDAIRVADDRVVLVIADVCGHGMQAALLASTLHAVLNVLLPGGMDLSAVAKVLNEYLRRTLEAGRFATAACVELDLKTGLCRSVRAGHPPPLVVQASGGWRALKCSEHLPLGIEEDPSIGLEEDRLAPGEMLALYSDGMFEVGAHRGPELGYRGLAEQLAAIVAREGGGSCAQVARTLLKFVEELQEGGLAADDQSLLVVRRC